jgi:hypothetical protein
MLNTLDFILTDDSPGTHIFAKRKQLGISLTKMYWLLGCKSNPLYQQQTPPLQSNTQTHLDIWHSTLGHDLKFQHRNFGTFSVGSLIVNVPWYVPNSVIRKDLRIPSVKEEISRFSSHYAVRLHAHPN